MEVDLGSPCYLDKWDESSLTMSPFSNLVTPGVEQHAQPADSEGSYAEASYCSSEQRSTSGSSSLGCSYKEPPWLGQDVSTLRLEARLSAIESTLELRYAELDAKISLLTSTATQVAETVKKRTHQLQEAVDEVVLKFQQSCNVSAAQTADLSECLRQSSDTQARLKADIDNVWFQVNTHLEAFSAGGLQRVPDSAPSSPSGYQQGQQPLPVQKGPQYAADESQTRTLSPQLPRQTQRPELRQTPQPATPDQADAAGEAAGTAVTAAPAAIVSPEAQDLFVPAGGPPSRQQNVACEPRKSLQHPTPQVSQACHRRTVTPLRPVVRASTSPAPTPMLALRQLQSPHTAAQQQPLMSGPQVRCTSLGASVMLNPRMFQNPQHQQQTPQLFTGSSACCPPRAP
mmetsp:Transcript_133820/g.267016  ORF Transcript_133820/g.267016 Transcript_133820/m.267016 type:complete len:400 (+) Transcript_133820:138-1337(+)